MSESKRRVGYRAVDETLHSGMKLGIGSGTTVYWSIMRIGELLKTGKLRDISVVVTSLDSEILCRNLGISVLSMNDCTIQDGLDLTIDGADEASSKASNNKNCALIKGGGAAHLREKIVVYASRMFVCVVDHRKIVAKLCEKMPVPLEIYPMAIFTVQRRLDRLKLKYSLRTGTGKLGPITTDNGNLIIDVQFPPIEDPRKLEAELNTIPGVLENGIFAQLPETALYICNEDESITVEKYPSTQAP